MRCVIYSECEVGGPAKIGIFTFSNEPKRMVACHENKPDDKNEKLKNKKIPVNR